MSLSPDELLLLLRTNGVPVAHMFLENPADPSTWVLQADGGAGELVDLSPDARAHAIALLQAQLGPGKPTVSKLNFLKLLTPAEWGDIKARAAAGDATLTYALALLDASFQLTPTEPTFQQMLAYCVTVGVFTSPRATAIVAAMGT